MERQEVGKVDVCVYYQSGNKRYLVKMIDPESALQGDQVSLV